MGSTVNRHGRTTTDCDMLVADNMISMGCHSVVPKFAELYPPRLEMYFPDESIVTQRVGTHFDTSVHFPLVAKMFKFQHVL